jgi:tetratricopeptide (TPR) repeat protein
MKPFPADRIERLAPASLPLLVALVYAVAFPGHFFMDDAQIVLDNLLVYSPDLKVIFTADYWGAGENTGLYRPLTILSFAVNQMVFGPAAWGYLLVNLLLHALVCLLLYRWLRGYALPLSTSWLAAALFAVHPIHGEAVIQLVGRSELLTAAFVLLALLAARQPGWRGNLGTAAAFLGAILSKEHGVVLIGLIPAVDLFFSREPLPVVLRRRAALLTALILITVVWLLYRYYVVHGGIPEPVALDPYYIPFASVDAPTRILSALKLQLLYLGKMLFPVHLQGMYPQSTVVPFLKWLSWQGLAVVAVVAAFFAAMVWGWRRHALWGLALGLYVISFAPTANLFIVAGFTMAERIAYLPSLWFCMAAATLLAELPRLFGNRTAMRFLPAALVTVYAVTGVARFYEFREPERYWLSDLAINPRNELSMIMLADYYRGQGRFAEAERWGRELISVAPDFKEGHSNLAGTLVEMGRPQEAIPIARRAIELEKPGAVSSAKIPLAAAYLKLGRVEEALETLQLVRITDRNQPVYWELYGKALEAKGDLLGALACYQKEAASSGGRARDGLRRLGKVLLQLGRYAEGETHLRRDVRINSREAEGWNALGIALDLQGKNAEAREAFARAVELRPESREYRANLERSRGVTN